MDTSNERASGAKEPESGESRSKNMRGTETPQPTMGKGVSGRPPRTDNSDLGGSQGGAGTSGSQVRTDQGINRMSPSPTEQRDRDRGPENRP